MRCSAKFLAAVAALSATLSAVEPVRDDPFAFLSPDLVVDPRDYARLDLDQTVVRVLAGGDGFLAISAIVRVDANADRLLTWSRRVELLQKGKYVAEIGRFSLPPRLEDLRGLSIDPGDLDALEDCRPGSCGVKLSDAEIARVRAAPDRAALEQTFRQLIVERAAQYLSRGDSCALPYHDHKGAVRPQEAFAAVVERLEFFPRRLPSYAAYLRSFPETSANPVEESFLYWSKETLGMKPIISITHFSAARFLETGRPEVAVVAKQVYASHYKDAAITVTALTGSGAQHYLVYTHRSRVDAFHGLFGGMVRKIVERRVKAEAPGVLFGLRQRIDGGDPPR
jgi:hypothetical protein